MANELNQDVKSEAADDHAVSSTASVSTPDAHPYPDPELRRRLSKHVQLDLSSRPERPWGSAVQPRSYPRGPFRSPARSRRSSGAVTPISQWSARTSVSTINLQQLLEKLEMDQYDTYGVEELRDGFFDASFFRPLEDVTPGNSETAHHTDALSRRRFPSEFLRNIASGVVDFFVDVFTTYEGVRLGKSLVAYMICFGMCLIPSSQRWLGPYNHWATIAVLLNHPARTVGAQLDGTVLCTFGAVVGLAWGSAALKLADTIGRGEGFLHLCIILFVFVIAWLRGTTLRLYQALMSAGLAAFFLVHVVPFQPHWDGSRVKDFALPWLVGLAVCQVVNIALFPRAGGREIVVALHNAFVSTINGLALSRGHSPDVNQNLKIQAVNLSEAFRDMRIELTLSRLRPADIFDLRNTLQAIIRDLMVVDPMTSLFDPQSPLAADPSTPGGRSEHFSIDIDTPGLAERSSFLDPAGRGPSAFNFVKDVLSGPTRDLIGAMTRTLAACDRQLMDIAGYSQLFSEPNIHPNEGLQEVHAILNASIISFDEADTSLIDHPVLPQFYSKHPELVQLFLFVHPLRQAAESIEILARKIMEISVLPNARSMKVHLPSYPWRKALYRTNPQVKHDRGGLSAAYYFQTKKELDEIMAKCASLAPSASNKLEEKVNCVEHNIMPDRGSVRYKIWSAMHRMQEFEGRFAVKLTLVTALLSLPAWLNGSKGWYYQYSAWWAVVAAWFMMHPRVGGNVQDLAIRSISAALGAVWGGLAYHAGKGNPYVMAVFAVVFMFPAMYRFTISSHPRSGLMACLSFTVVSLKAHSTPDLDTAAMVSKTSGTAMVVGVCAAVVVNWCIWPFVARHELRKSISNMMLHLATTYSGIVARYIYPEQGSEPTKEDIQRSQMLEEKLREGFVRMRELLDMTLHEIRLRGPFNPNPYASLIDSLSNFFEHLVLVRHSSLYLHSDDLLSRLDEQQRRELLSFRRDAVASILMNLYTLAGALRLKRRVPRYLPNAAVARKRLVDRMEETDMGGGWERNKDEEGSGEVEGEGEGEGNRQGRLTARGKKRWADIYQFAYSSALTDIVRQLEEIQTYTKEICGEMALDVRDY